MKNLNWSTFTFALACVASPGGALAQQVPVSVSAGKKIETAKVSWSQVKPTRLGRAGGSNNGGSGRGSAAVAETLAWCSGSLGVLREYRSHAMLAALSDDLRGAYESLQEGMEKALERAQSEDAFSSMTWRAISRGVELASLLEAVAGELDASYETRLSFLLRYYDFVDRVSTGLDVPYYVPSRGGRVDEGQFEARFVEYAREQLAWLIETYVGSNPVFGALPRLPVKMYLGVLEFLVVYSADDLAESLWAAKHACSIEELRLMGEKLAGHNAGNLAYYRNDRGAVNATYPQITRIARSLGQACGRN